MKRSKPLARTSRLARGARIKAVNRKRRQTEFARCYGSRARVAFVKGLPCIVCFMSPSDNAHTVTDGMGRKAAYTAIVPLCRRCHQDYDQHRGDLAGPTMRRTIQNMAPKIEQLWQAHLNATRTAA